MKNNFKIKKCRKNIYISAVYSTVIWCLALLLTVSDARFLGASNAFYSGKNISNFAEATREKRFTTMTPLGMSRDTDYDVITASQIASNSS